MLGVLSLGSLIDDANTRLYYDDLVLYVLLGAALVFAGDMVSGKGRSDLFVPLKEKALSDARYWAREEASANCEKLGVTPSLSPSATTYSDGACQRRGQRRGSSRCGRQGSRKPARCRYPDEPAGGSR